MQGRSPACKMGCSDMNWLRGLINKLFRRQPLTIPYPEERPDYLQTIGSLSIDRVITAWLIAYSVPVEYWDYWRTEGVRITVTSAIAYAAGTYELDGKRYMDIRPEWVNSGVIAHEQAHNSYALLTVEQRLEFSSIYKSLIPVVPLMKLLYSINPYGLVNAIEGHAECYRYLARSMPSALHSFYPKLLV